MINVSDKTVFRRIEEISFDSTTLEPDRLRFFTIRSQKSRDALIAREWNDGISRTITSKISKLTVFPLPRTERGEETYTCTYRHRSGLDIAWVRRCALSRYTPDTAYHDFYPSIKTKGSISSFCTVPRLRWRILRSSLYTYIYVNNPVGSRCIHSHISMCFVYVSCTYTMFCVYFSRVDVG